MRLGLTLAAALACGCAAGDDYGVSDTDDFIDQDAPPGNCSAGTSAAPCPDPGTTGSPEGGPCLDSQDCTSGTSCVAPFEDGQVGAFTCTAVCIPLMDEGAWCLDDTACCDAGAVCSARGLCVMPEGGLDESGTGTGDDSGTTGDGTSTGATEGTSTGTSGGSGSDTGAATGTTGMQ